MNENSLVNRLDKEHALNPILPERNVFFAREKIREAAKKWFHDLSPQDRIISLDLMMSKSMEETEDPINKEKTLSNNESSDFDNGSDRMPPREGFWLSSDQSLPDEFMEGVGVSEQISRPESLIYKVKPGESLMDILRKFLRGEIKR